MCRKKCRRVTSIPLLFFLVKLAFLSNITKFPLTQCSVDTDFEIEKKTTSNPKGPFSKTDSRTLEPNLLTKLKKEKSALLLTQKLCPLEVIKAETVKELTIANKKTASNG